MPDTTEKISAIQEGGEMPTLKYKNPKCPP